MNYSELRTMMEHGDRNLLVLGRGGSGKTFLVNQFLESTELNVLRTAPTGLAAMAIDGASTNHAAFGLLPTVSFSGTIPRLSPDHAKAIQKADVWLVDEVSMVRGDQLMAIDRVLKCFRHDPRPLGGIRLIAVGDLWQLSPVATEIEEDCLSRMALADPLLCHGVYGTSIFESILESTTIVELQGVFRQNPQERDFVGLLDRCRRGTLTPADLELLGSRVSHSNPNGTTILTTTRKARDLYNNACLQQLPWKEWKIRPDVRWSDGEVHDETLLADCPGAKTVSLKLGMRVMFTKNDPNGCWVNGTQGRLVSVDPIDTNEPNRLAIQVDGRPWFDIVHRQDFGIFVPHFDEEKQRGTVRRVATVGQFPVEPAYACTIHRSQGRTLPSAIVHLGSGAFASGQTYVALSRVPSLAALHLATPILSRDIIVSAAAKQFYERFHKEILPIHPN